MQEVFRTRSVEAPVTQEMAPPRVSTQKSEEIPVGAKKAQEPETLDEKNIEIWEGLHRTKYVAEYFNTKEFEGEFNVKMLTSQVDKYVKSQLEERGYEKNTENWNKVIQEIESEIGSENLELFKRLQKITGYINVVNRLSKLKTLKEKYKTLST